MNELKSEKRTKDRDKFENILFFSLFEETDLLSGDKKFEGPTRDCRNLLSKCINLVDLVRQTGPYYLKINKSQQHVKEAISCLVTLKSQWLDYIKNEIELDF